MADKTIVQRLMEQIERSDEYTTTNFGAKIGDGFPELVRGVASERRLCVLLLLQYMKATTSADKVTKGLSPNDPTGGIMKTPALYEAQLSFLFWGIEIGRELEREQAAALESIAADAAKEGK